MNRDKREPEYPAELESQFILKLPEEPSKVLREILKSGENLKNRLTINIDNDMRHGEVRFDHWLMHSKIVDLPTIVESLKTIDNKSFYKTADICQMMICKDEPDQPTLEEESPVKNKKKDPYKVEKKFLWPHGVTPPSKNVRKRRFRKTLKKKYAEAPEIEKEVKRLLRADNEAVSVTWEVIKEEEDTYSHKSDRNQSTAPSKPEKKSKQERAPKREQAQKPTKQAPQIQPSDVDIFGGNLSDSDLEDDNMHNEMDDSHYSTYDSRMSDTNSMQEISDMQKNLPTEFKPHMFPKHGRKTVPSESRGPIPSGSGQYSEENMSEDDITGDYPSRNKEDMSSRIEQLRAELEELKQRRQRTQHEISGMENLALRQRFQDILHTLNQDIMYKEMEYQGMITLQNSDDI